MITDLAIALARVTSKVQPWIDPILNMQVLSISGGPTGGTFTLALSGVSGVTSAIEWNAQASDVQAALNNLLGSNGSVICTGGPLPSETIEIKFFGTIAATLLPLMSAVSSLTGGASPAVTVIPILQQVLSNTQICSIWQPNTAYLVNQQVVSPEFNGHVFICVQSATSGASEPEWNLYPLHAPWDASRYLLTGDAEVVWQDNGRQPAALWNIRKAIHEGWLLKAQIASQGYQFKTGTESFNRNQVFDMCMKI